MADKHEIYVDGIGKIHFVGGMVRYDMFTFEPPAESGKEPSQQEKIRIIMPPEAFLNTFNTMQRLIDQLIEAGVFKKNEKK